MGVRYPLNRSFDRRERNIRMKNDTHPTDLAQHMARQLVGHDGFPYGTVRETLDYYLNTPGYNEFVNDIHEAIRLETSDPWEAQFHLHFAR